MVYKMAAILYRPCGDKVRSVTYQIILDQVKDNPDMSTSFSISRLIKPGDNPFSPADNLPLYTGLSEVHPDVDLGSALIGTSRI